MEARRLGDTPSAGWATLGCGMQITRKTGGVSGGSRLLGALASNESPLFAHVLPRPPDPPLAIPVSTGGEGSGGGDGGSGGEGGGGGGGGSGGEGEGGDGE